MRRILITGAAGFIGRNLAAQLSVRPGGWTVVSWTRHSSTADLQKAVADADFICHLAGVNRPDDPSEFVRGNTDLTRTLCQHVSASERAVPIIFASSAQVDTTDSTGTPGPYATSKLAAEQILLEYSRQTGAPVHIFRLPHVFGKWCRPNYNSVVATFCYNIARDLPIHIHHPESVLRLVYVDDVVDTFARIMMGDAACGPQCDIEPIYPMSVGELATHLRAFRASRQTLISGPVGTGVMRALYATYVSYLPPDAFVYATPRHDDARGLFVEMLKTTDAGQFSFFTAHPGVTRGGHYHHSKTEKFLVVKGTARFRFRDIVSNAVHEVVTSGDAPQIVDTAPGWAHDITNVGDDEMIVMLWANETFDRDRPDTFQYAVQP